MSETSHQLPFAWIEKVFSIMEGFYGSALMSGIWGNDPSKLSNTFELWAGELRNFKDHPGAIKYALKNLPEKPPNLFQFRELCREGIKHEPKPVAIEEKITPEQMAKNRERIKGILDGLKRNKEL